jgi:hypothetical protein
MTNPASRTRGGGAALQLDTDRVSVAQATDPPWSDTFWPVAQRRCPLTRAAWRTGDPDVVAVVARVHPPIACPAARRHRHLQAVGGG